jgi:hypothetical protein
VGELVGLAWVEELAGLAWMEEVAEIAVVVLAFAGAVAQRRAAAASGALQAEEPYSVAANGSSW